jgi:hypothetical protein
MQDKPIAKHRQVWRVTRVFPLQGLAAAQGTALAQGLPSRRGCPRRARLAAIYR